MKRIAVLSEPLSLVIEELEMLISTSSDNGEEASVEIAYSPSQLKSESVIESFMPFSVPTNLIPVISEV